MTTATRADIHHAVAERARQRGSRNAQAFAHLKHWLSKAQPDELFWGLLQPFLTRNGDTTYDVQALSARLLLCLNPPCRIGLEMIIQQIASYDLSVEELPWYFAKQFGADQLLATLERIPAEIENAIASRLIETFKYWIAGEWRQRADDLCR
jgi:hypothetical protein